MVSEVSVADIAMMRGPSLITSETLLERFEASSVPSIEKNQL